MAEGDDVSDNFAHTDYQIAALKNKWGNKSKDTIKKKKYLEAMGGGAVGDHQETLGCFWSPQRSEIRAKQGFLGSQLLTQSYHTTIRLLHIHQASTC